MSFQSIRGGVGYSDTTSDSDSKRRQQLAQIMLQQSNAAPAVGWTGALNKILAGGIAGYQMGKDSEEQTARGHAKNATMADALRAGQGQAAETKTYGDGTTINWDERKGDPQMMASILASNPDTAGAGFQMQTNQIDAKAKAEADLARELRTQQADLAKEQRTHQHAIDLERNKSIAIPGNGGGIFIPDAPGTAPTGGQPAPQAVPDLRTSPAAPNPPPVQQQDLAAALSGSESGGRPGVVNKEGYSGKYQFGEAAATEAGFYTPDDNPNDNKWNGTFKNLPGVSNYQDFLKNEGAQDHAFNMHQTHLNAEIDGRGLDKYIGQNVGGVTITRDGLISMMHLGGPAGTQKYLESGGKYNPGDSNGTRLSDYGTKFANTGAQPPAQDGRVQVADASGAIPASVPAPGPAPGQERTTIGGRQGTIYRSPGSTADGGAKVPPGYRQNPDGSLSADPTYVETETKLRQAGQAPAQETKLRSGLGELQAKTVEDWKSASAAARATKASIDQMTGALDTGLKTGWGAEGKKATATFLQGIGLPADVTNIFFSTADAKQFEAASNQMVLGMVKGLGPNPSNADREFIERTVPTMRDDPNAVRRVADFVKQKSQESIDRFKFGYAHYKDGGDPLEFDDLWAGRQTRTANGKTYYQIGGQVYEAGN